MFKSDKLQNRQIYRISISITKCIKTSTLSLFLSPQVLIRTTVDSKGVKHHLREMKGDLTLVSVCLYSLEACQDATVCALIDWLFLLSSLFSRA